MVFVFGYTRPAEKTTKEKNRIQEADPMMMMKCGGGGEDTTSTCAHRVSCVCVGRGGTKKYGGGCGGF